MTRIFQTLLACSCALGACQRTRTTDNATHEQGSSSACPASARELVTRFGVRLRQVSILAPDTVAAREIRRAYAPLVTGELLARWLASPAVAPGRDASNPWPARIVIDSMTGNDVCSVAGAIVYVTTTDTVTPVEQKAVRLELSNQDGWRVSAFEIAAGNATATAHQVLREYFDAINARDYRAAFQVWENGGRASGQTFSEFAKGFDQTVHVSAQMADSVQVGGAAGSQYTTIPVVLEAVLRNGRRQHFEGSYTLRRSLVDGATPEQRRWHIYSARIS